MTASKGVGRGGFRVFSGKKARQLRAAMKRIKAERERKSKPLAPPASDPEVAD